METENQSTTITSFVLWGFSHNLSVNLFLFFAFLFIYVLTLLGNIVIMVATSDLSTTMYFFLAHLAFLDICLASVTVPKLLEILTKRQTISYPACLGQMFFTLLTGSNEVCILAVMAYGRFAAICKPLCYVQIMNKACCRWLVGGAWTITFSYAFINTFSALKLSFCRANFIKHFSCELPSLFELSCTDTLPNWILFFIIGGVIIICSFTFILFSYIQIISTILKLNSAEAKRKSFSTCRAHLILVVLYYNTGCFRYTSSIIVDELISIKYNISTPMLNPLIYSLKNKEVKEAIKTNGLTNR